MMDWNDGGSWWAWVLMIVGMLAVWGVIIWAVLALARDRFGWDGAPRPSPETILRERFAGGEIDEAEYQQRLEALRTPISSPGASAD